MKKRIVIGAYAVCQVKSYKATRKRIKKLQKEVVSVGFPASGKRRIVESDHSRTNGLAAKRSAGRFYSE
jgi:hypothetical protein